MRVRLQSPDAPAADYDLDGPEIVIGRGANSTLVLPDSRVSRRHVRIVERDGGWWVEDLDTRNGTLLNGEKIAGVARLIAGDRLGIGGSVVEFIGDPKDAIAISAGTAPLVLDPDRIPVTTPESRDAVRMRALNQIHKALAESLSLSELLDLILARCFDVLDPEEGVIVLRGTDGTLSSAAHRRVKPDGTPVTIPRRLVEEVVGKRQPALVLDAAYDDRFAGSASMASSGIRSVVAAPLVDAEGALGLITLCSRVAVRQFTQPDLDMLVSIASAVALRVRNVALADELASRRVIEHELALAHDVQMSMLPREMPQRPDVALAARLKPARSIGGDLYDFVLDGDRLWFIVADVAGKSIAAALYMAIVRTLFRATAGGDAAVIDVAARMNQELCRDNEGMMFVTAAIGCLHLPAGAVMLVDAGHNPALVIGPGRAFEIPDVPKGIALGVLPQASYREARITLEPGSTLVLYTDGLTDARGTTGEMFGEDRLHAAIGAAGVNTPAGLVAAVMGVIERFAAGAPQDDDLTLLALRYSG
jgi:sigma-B regulation protein RsbU (phosphoserine phosphatase)